MKDILGFELSELAAVVKRENEDNEQFLKYIKRQKHPNLDHLAHKLNEEACDKIDCLACGNCCRALGPRLNRRDIETIAKFERMDIDQFMKEYIRSEIDGGFTFKTMPCRFLEADNRCFIYEKRPKACADYPHTDNKKMVQLLPLTVKNAAFCPIAYLVLDGLKRNFNYRTKQS